jgi:hypothetical protein
MLGLLSLVDSPRLSGIAAGESHSLERYGADRTRTDSVRGPWVEQGTMKHRLLPQELTGENRDRVQATVESTADCRWVVDAAFDGIHISRRSPNAQGNSLLWRQFQ